MERLPGEAAAWGSLPGEQRWGWLRSGGGARGMAQDLGAGARHGLRQLGECGGWGGTEGRGGRRAHSQHGAGAGKRRGGSLLRRVLADGIVHLLLLAEPVVERAAVVR
jgi:hypothetical protein